MATPPRFSADAGDTPRRPVINEIFWRLFSAAKDGINFGILPWDTDVDTLAGGVKQVSGVIYRALVDNGPTYSNAISPTTAGQTVWEIVSGTIGLPSAPAQPTATAPASGELDWSWNCPLDGGAAITSFNFYWRTAGTLAFSAAISVTTPRYVLTGLTNGTAIEAQVEAVNAQGTSPPSAVGSATPQGTVPGGGATLALRATAGDGEVDAGLAGTGHRRVDDYAIHRAMEGIRAGIQHGQAGHDLRRVDRLHPRYAHQRHGVFLSGAGAQFARVRHVQ